MVWATAWTTTSEAGRSNWATCQKEGLWWWTWPGSALYHAWNSSLNTTFLFSLNLVTVWRTTSGMGSLLKWKERAQRKVRRGNDKTALHLPSVTLCSGARRYNCYPGYFAPNLLGSSGFWMEVEETVLIWMWNQPGQEATQVTQCQKFLSILSWVEIKLWATMAREYSYPFIVQGKG